MALKRCPTCLGKGKVPGDNYNSSLAGVGWKPCPGECNGGGWIVSEDEPDSTGGR